MTVTYQPDDAGEDELADGLTDDQGSTWSADDADDSDPFDHVRVRARRPKRERRRAAEPMRKTEPSDEDEDWGSQARARPIVRRRRRDEPEEFRCRHCRVFVVSVPSGGKHRNHCPTCLHSRHVDERLPGDRLSTCGGTMAPIGRFQRAGGEYMLLHRCMDCGVERRNRIAADDDFDLVLTLPEIVPPGPGNDPASDLA